MARIFITYRSEDPGWSVALDRELSIAFGPEQVFRASRAMQLGESFPDRIRVGIANASVLLAVIGPRWLEPQADGLRRIDDPDDWVRREIRLALEAGLLVVPCWWTGVRPLVADELPDDVRALAERQYVRLGHKDAEADISRLIERLQQRVPGLAVLPRPGERQNGRVGDASASDEEEPRAPLWLTLTGLAILLLSGWLPWVDGDPIIALPWTEWSNAMILPEGVLIVAALFAATGCLLRGRYPAIAVGVVGVSGLLTIVNPRWFRTELLDGSEYLYQLGLGFLVCMLGGVVLLAALGTWAWRWFPAEPRHSNRSASVIVGAVLERHRARIPDQARRASAPGGGRLALAYAAAGDPEVACGVAHHVLDDALFIDSATLRHDLRRLGRALNRWRTRSDVQSVSPRLAEALRAPTSRV